MEGDTSLNNEFLSAAEPIPMVLKGYVQRVTMDFLLGPPAARGLRGHVSGSIEVGSLFFPYTAMYDTGVRDIGEQRQHCSTFMIMTLACAGVIPRANGFVALNALTGPLSNDGLIHVQQVNEDGTFLVSTDTCTHGSLHAAYAAH